MHVRPFRKVFFLLFLFLYLPFAYHQGISLYHTPLVDLPSFYYAAQTAFGHHQSPYPPGALAWGAQALGQKVWPFLYPPPTLMLFFPFAHMPYKAAKLLVIASSHLCILALLFLVLHLLGLTPLFRRRTEMAADTAESAAREKKEWLALFLLAYVIAYQPIVSTLKSGQIDLYVVVLLCLTWAGMKRSAAPALVALPLVLAIVLKTYPLLLLPVLLIKGRWRLVLWTVGGLAALAGCSVAALPRAAWHDWLAFVAPYGAYGKSPMGLFPVFDVWNQSLNGFAARLFLSPHTAVVHSMAAARIVPAMLSAGVVAGAIALSWRLRRALQMQGAYRDQETDSEMSLFLLSMFLVAPLSWDHHLVFVLPAVCVAFSQILLGRQPRRVMIWVAVPAFLLAWPIPVDAAVLDMHTGHLLLSLKMYAVAVLWAYFAARLWRLGHTDAPEHCVVDEEERAAITLVSA